MNTQELFDLIDEELINLIGQNVLIRISQRNQSDPDDGSIETEEPPFKEVVAVGTLLELQFSPDTGGSIAYLYNGSEKPDEVRWDSEAYRADFSWKELL